MNCRTWIIPTFAALGWLLTVILVTQLLSGTFDTRSCTTACSQILYWSAFAIAVVGFVGGCWMLLRGCKSLPAQIGTVALGLLLLIFLTMMFIGTFL